MRVAGRPSLGFVLRAGGRERREPGADAIAGRAVHADAILWEPENEGVAGQHGPSSESQTRCAADGVAGHRGRVSEAEAEPAGRRPPDLPILVAGHHGGARQPGVEHRYHVYPDGAGFRVPGRGHGLVQPVRTELVAVFDAGGRVLCGGAEARLAAGAAGYLQLRPRIAVHQREIHWGVGGPPDRDQHGRAGPLPGQHFCGAPVAFAEIRGGVLERLCVGAGSTSGHRRLLPVLQPPASAPESRLPDAGGDLFGMSATAITGSANARRRALLNSGTPSPNPWDLSLSRQNGCFTLEALERRIGLRRDAPRAPIQGPEWQGAASPPPQTQTQTPPDISLLRAKNGLDNGVHFIKRGLIGSFHKVSVKHLRRYLDEFTFRFNNREAEDLFALVVLNLVIASGIKYAELTAKPAPSEASLR